IARGGAGRNHVAVLRLAGNLPKIRVSAAGKIMEQVVDVLERSEEVITGRAAGKSKEVGDFQNSLDVFGCRVGLEDDVPIAAGPAVPVPERIYLFQLAHDQIVPDLFAVIDLGRQIKTVTGIEILAFD